MTTIFYRLSDRVVRKDHTVLLDMFEKGATLSELMTAANKEAGGDVLSIMAYPDDASTSMAVHEYDEIMSHIKEDTSYSSGPIDE